MLTALMAFAVFVLVALGMSAGLLLSGKPLTGSCGGLNNGSCELCGAKSPADCAKRT